MVSHEWEWIRQSAFDGGIEAAAKLYFQLKGEAPSIYDFSEGEMNRLGYDLLREGRTSAAISLFLLNCEKFPDSANVYDSMGEAYLKAGKID